jgi:hypothetical protein
MAPKNQSSATPAPQGLQVGSTTQPVEQELITGAGQVG